MSDMQRKSEDRTTELFADFQRDKTSGSVTVTYNFHDGHLRVVEISSKRVERLTDPPQETDGA